MKKSCLSGLFDEESSSPDKSLLTYHRPHQPRMGRTSAESPPPTSNSSSCTKDTPDVENSLITEKPQESSPPVAGKGTYPSSGNTPSNNAAGGPPELLHSCIVSAFTFSGSQSIPLGSLGCALYWEPSRHCSLLVLYRSRQQQICLLTLSLTSLPTIQPQLYVSFQCDAGKQFSIHLASQPALREFAMKAVLAAALASEAGMDGGSPAALPLSVEDEASSSGGRRARNGDSLSLEITEWGVQKPRSDPLRQRRGACSVPGTLDSSWRTVLRGARPGQRWLVGDPASRDLVREVLVVAVRPPPRQAPLQLPADDGTDWRLGDEGASPSPESPPSPPPSPSQPALEGEQTVTDTRARTEEETDQRDAPEEGEHKTAAPAPSKGRGNVLARMARLGQQMFPSAAGAVCGQSPSPPPSPPPSPATRSSSPPNVQTSIATVPTAAAATVAATAEAGTVAAVSRKASAGSKPTVAPHRPLPAPRPPVAPRPDSSELCVLFGRLEAKLETVLLRLAPPPGVDADAETLAAGVRKLAAENATLREATRQADQAAELRLEAERARAAMATELADSLAELTQTRKTLAETQRRLAAAEEAASEAAVEAARREADFETELAAAKSAAAAGAAAVAKGSEDAAESARAAKEPRRVLKGVYKTLRSRLPAEGTFTGTEVGEIVAEVVRETLQRVETETRRAE